MLNKNIVVTAGPTYEKIDPVRFIGNFSSGKMGFSIAENLAKLGAKVTLVTGPVNLNLSHKNVNLVSVLSTKEMYTAVAEYFKKSDGAILSAAVADYKPKNQSANKIKHKKNNLILELEPTIDIAESLGKVKKKNQFLIGFALETEHEINNAKEKLKKKNFDLIVLNSLKERGAGFGYDTNKICIIDKHNNLTNFELKSKKDVALDIINKLIEIL